MSSRPATGTSLDVALALKRSVQVLGQDFIAIAIAGVAFVLLPGGLLRGVGGGAGDHDGLATVLMTLRGVGVMLFVALVSTGVVARLQGQALPTGAFLRRGLVAAQPGVQAGLIIAAAIFVGLIVQLFARHGTVAGWLLDVLLLALGLAGACVLLPVIPAAVTERLSPRAAFARAAVLTEGNRNRILGLVLLIGLTLAPLLALAGGAAGLVGPWALALVELAGYTLAAIVPAAVYAGLKEAA